MTRSVSRKIKSGELEWFACTTSRAQLDRLLDVVARSSNDRKLRLFARAVALSSFLTLNTNFPAFATALQMADGARLEADRQFERDQYWLTCSTGIHAARAALGCTNGITCVSSAEAVGDLLRGTFGNPYRKVVLAEVFRTPEILSLAQSAYDDYRKTSVSGNPLQGSLDPVRLSVLADALEEAGYPVGLPCPECQTFARKQTWEYLACHATPTLQTGTGLLEHLRALLPRYPGDWALDLVLGKT